MALDKDGNIILTKDDSARRQELHDKYKEQWSHPAEMDVEYRIAEKERDAELIKDKACGQLKALLENTSLLALNNEQLASLLSEAQAFVAELSAEARRRE